MWTWKKKNIKYNYNDVSLGNENNFLTKANDIILNHGIDKIILSVGPFNYSSILIEIKKLFPKISIAIDFRDYWEDGLKDLTIQQIARERSLQDRVLKCVSLIICPNHEMQKHFDSLQICETFLLPHCFDSDDFKHLSSQNGVHNSNMVKLIYGGAFYSDLENALELFCHFLQKVNMEIEVEVQFYVSTIGYECFTNHKNIKRKGFISGNDFFEKVRESDFTLLFLPPDRRNARSSKFFELVALRKPILYFGESGEVSEFIIKNNLGAHITCDTLKGNSTLVSFLRNIEINRSFSCEEYSFENQTQILLKNIERLR